MEGPQLADRQLTAALWFVNHRIVLRRILIITLIVIAAAFWGYVIFAVARDIFQLQTRRASELELLGSGASISDHVQAAAPQEIGLAGVETLVSGEVTDVIVRLQNLNPVWRARFRYTIGMGGENLVARDGFLLPGEERLFFNSFRGGRGTPDFRLEQVAWFRVAARQTPDIAAFTEERLRFDVQNTAFVSAQSGDRGAVDRAKFSITNKTAYGFFEPKFLVLLYRGERLVGVQSTVLDQFKSGATREVEVSWFDRVGAVSRVEVIPEIDIFDPSVYMRLE